MITRRDCGVSYNIEGTVMDGFFKNGRFHTDVDSIVSVLRKMNERIDGEIEVLRHSLNCRPRFSDIDKEARIVDKLSADFKLLCDHLGVGITTTPEKRAVTKKEI